MKKPQINLFNRSSYGVLRKSPDGAEVEPVLRQSMFHYAPLLAGALVALATIGAPVSAHAQKAILKQTESRDDGKPGDLKTEKSTEDQTVRRAVDDFKLKGSDEPDFPPASAELSRGTLRVQGTQTRDLIEIQYSGDWVEVWISDNTNPSEPIEFFFDTFHRDEVEKLLVFGLASRDVIINTTSIPDFIWGGLGDDTILAGNGDSHLYGQGGDDTLNGNGGDDYLWGGTEGDLLYGGLGSDLVSGDDGRDWVSGGDEYGTSDDDFDQLVGGAGADIFTVPPADLAEDILYDYDPAEGDELDD